jgi:hypothetical protein
MTSPLAWYYRTIQKSTKFSYIYIVVGMILQNFTTELEVYNYFYIVT